VVTFLGVPQELFRIASLHQGSVRWKGRPSVSLQPHGALTEARRHSSPCMRR